MAGIKGITIEIGGETTKLQSALKGATDKGRETATELGKINNALKYDTDNLVLIAQKMDVLKDRVSATEEKLNVLKSAQEDVEKQFKNGDIGADEYRAFQREIIEAESKLKKFKTDLTEFEESTKKSSKITVEEFQKINEALKLNPDNIVLIAQKIDGLKEQVVAAEEQLNTLKSAQEDVEKQFKNGDIGADEYRAFQREIIEAESKMKKFKTDLTEFEESTKKSSKITVEEFQKINEALKLNPDNIVLIAQKIDGLKEQVAAAEEQLNTLKSAQEDVEKQFKNGDIGADEYRAFCREIEETENKLKNFKDQLKDTEKDFKDHTSIIGKVKDAYDDFKDKIEKLKEEHPKLTGAFDKSTDAAKKFGEGLGKSVVIGIEGAGAAMTGLIAGGTAMVNKLLEISENTKELRGNLGQLETAFATNNLTVEQSKSSYVDLYSVLGDSDKATETATHISAIADSEKELSEWTDICTGVYGRFGNTLPTEALAEAANETSKTGKLTGALADALNWAGESEEEFQTKLDACSTEQERQALITETLNGLYGESAEKYREINATLINAQKAQAEYSLSLADLGGAVDKIKNEAIADFLPGISTVVDGLTALLSGDASAPELIQKGIEEITAGIENFVPKVTGIIENFTDVIAEITPEIITVFINGILDNLEPIIDAAFEMLEALTTGLLDQGNIEKLVHAAVSLVSNLVEFLGNNADLIVDSAFVIIDSLIDGLLGDDNSEKLVKGALDIVMAICKGLISNAPELIVGAAELIGVLVEEILQYDWWQVAKDIVGGLISGVRNVFADEADGSHAGGIGYVPYNGYTSELHEGERILTAAENRNYNLQQQEKTAERETMSRRLDALERAINQKTVNNIHVTATGSARSVVRGLSFYIDEENTRQGVFDKK